MPKRPGLAHQLGRGNNLVDEPDPQCFVGFYLPAGEQDIEGDTLADEPRQPLRAGVAGNDPEVDLGLTEARRIGCQSHRARHRQLAASAERETVDRGDHGLAHVFDQIENVLAPDRVFLPLCRRLYRELVDVGARDE